jgi:hypothetical protein
MWCFRFILTGRLSTGSNFYDNGVIIVPGQCDIGCVPLIMGEGEGLLGVSKNDRLSRMTSKGPLELEA